MSYEKQMMRCVHGALAEVFKSWLDENRDEIIASLAACEAWRETSGEKEPNEAKQSEPTYFTPGQLAERWGFHPESVRRLLRRGILPRVWIGRRVLIPAEAVMEFEKDAFRPANSPGDI